jgi:hypothetical protein
MYSLALIIFVVSEKKAFEHFPIGSNVNPQMYVLQWRPSWISDRHKKQKLGKGHSNDHSLSLGSVSSLVSEKKIFKISANQSILLALAAMLNIRLERKTDTL